MIKVIKTKDLSPEDIPDSYHWDSFVKFALSFDSSLEKKDWIQSDYIDRTRLPILSDSIIGLREYLYSLQRINNQYIRDENELKERVEYVYKILRKKIRKLR